VRAPSDVEHGRSGQVRKVRLDLAARGSTHPKFVPQPPAPPAAPALPARPCLAASFRARSPSSECRREIEVSRSAHSPRSVCGAGRR
jgi:hypothetical protein